MKTSAGIIIIWKNKVLLCHASNAAWYKTYGPPKGMMDPGENAIETAIRETFEEIGVKIQREKLLAPIEVPYNNKNGDTFKLVIVFPIKIKTLDEINLLSEKIPLSQLQLAEVDDARFFGVEEFQAKVMPRYIEPLTQLIKKYESI